LRTTLEGLRLFHDLALMTRFADDHLHVRGILRVGE
jgi:hypothetical protein